MNRAGGGCIKQSFTLILVYLPFSPGCGVGRKGHRVQITQGSCWGLVFEERFIARQTLADPDAGPVPCQPEPSHVVTVKKAFTRGKLYHRALKEQQVF